MAAMIPAVYTKDFMNLPVSDEEDKALFDGYRVAKLSYDLNLYRTKHPTLNQDTSVKNYDKVLNKLSKKDTTSLTYLIASLYKYTPLRNDFNHMVLVKSENDIKPDINYMILPIILRAI